MTNFYLVRHAQSEGNVKKTMGGNPPLTPQGIAQAERLGQKLANVNFVSAWSSGLTRAVHTAKLILSGRDLEVTINPELRERGYGVYEGEPEEKYNHDLKEAFEMLDQMTEPERFGFRRYETFETDEEMSIRFTKALKEIAKTNPEGNVLVVSHGSILRIFLIGTDYATYSDLPPNAIGNCGLVKIGFDGEKFTNYVHEPLV